MARPGGNVYIIREKDGKIVTHLTDVDAMLPSRSFAAP